MKEVNAELYQFLKDNETGLYMDQYGEAIAYVHIHFSDLDDFTKIVGAGTFDDGGLDITMFKTTICVELNDIIEAEGHNLSSYKACFNKDDWEDCEEAILKYEKEYED